MEPTPTMGLRGPKALALRFQICGSGGGAARGFLAVPEIWAISPAPSALELSLTKPPWAFTQRAVSRPIASSGKAGKS